MRNQRRICIKLKLRVAKAPRPFRKQHGSLQITTPGSQKDSVSDDKFNDAVMR